ncbi:MAG: putative sulfate/molybdate transporter [Geminicoccaceae bacterium]
MFEPLSKSRTGADTDRAHGGWIGDLSGAFADLGTFLPLVIGLLVVGEVAPTGLLIGFGVFAVLTGVIYRLPMSVQPMKVVAALAIAGGLSASAMVASGMMLGVALIILGGFGLVTRMKRLVPRTVLLGIQFGLGLHLLVTSAAIADGALAIAASALAVLILLQATPLRSVSCLLLLVCGIGWSLTMGKADWVALSPAWHMPTIAMPAWSAFMEAIETVLWPQLALTLTNAVLLTSVLAADYFPSAKHQTSTKRLALSSGALNLFLAPIGAMPMCHGAGGLAAQYHQGARSGRAPVIFGAVCLALGLLAGPAALDWLLLVPLAIVAALLAFAGLHLMQPGRLAHLSPTCLAVIALTALTSLLVNVSVGLAAGLIAEMMRAVGKRFFQPTA